MTENNNNKQFKVINKKKYIKKKNNEEIEYIYDQSKYNKKYYDVHNELLKKYIKCEVCNCEITYYNISHHNKTSKHIKNLNNNNNNNNNINNEKEKQIDYIMNNFTDIDRIK